MGWLKPVVRGVALSVVATMMVFAVVLILGLATAGPAVFAGTALLSAAGVALTSPEPKMAVQAVGSALVAAVAILSGILTGFGWLQVAAVVGAALALFATLPHSWQVPVVQPWVVGLAGLVVVAVALVPLVINGGTFGHDEAAYALKGRTWLEGTPSTGWGVHRGPALSVYAYGILAVGGAEPGMRILGILSVIGLGAATWALGAKMGNRWVGPLSAVCVVAGPAMLRRGTEFLSDIPSAALLVVCMMIVWREFSDDDGPGYRLLWLLPFAWAAFYVRYQSLVGFGLIAVTVLVLWWGRVRRNPGPVVLLAIVGFVGLVPHFIFSLSATGTPWGILVITTKGVIENSLIAALIDYVRILGWPLAGFSGSVLTVAFLWSIFSAKTKSARDPKLFLLIPAVVQVFLVAIVRAAEPRFVFFPWALVVIGGMIGLFEIGAKLGSSWRRGVIVGLSILLVGSVALAIPSARRSVQTRIDANEPVELAALEVARLARGLSCGVLTSYTPQVTFYSTCETNIFRPRLGAVEEVDRLMTETRFMILVEDGKRQPNGSNLDDLMALATRQPVVVSGDKRSAAVFEFGS